MDQLAGLSLEIFIDICGLVFNHRNYSWPSKLDKTWCQSLESKCFQILSAIFMLASTFPLALIFIVITNQKKSRHFSSFADLLRNFGKTRLKCKKTLGRNSSQMSAVVAGKSTKARSWVPPIWKQNKKSPISKSLLPTDRRLWIHFFVVVLDHIRIGF